MYRNRNNSVILPSCARFRFLIFFAYLSCLEPIQSFCTCVHMCIKVCVLRVFGQTIFRYIFFFFFFFDDDRFRFLERISIWWIFFLFGERVFGKNCYENSKKIWYNKFLQQLNLIFFHEERYLNGTGLEELKNKIQ